MTVLGPEFTDEFTGNFRMSENVMDLFQWSDAPVDVLEQAQVNITLATPANVTLATSPSVDNVTLATSPSVDIVPTGRHLLASCMCEEPDWVSRHLDMLLQGSTNRKIV